MPVSQGTDGVVVRWRCFLVNLETVGRSEECVRAESTVGVKRSECGGLAMIDEVVAMPNSVMGNGGGEGGRGAGTKSGETGLGGKSGGPLVEAGLRGIIGATTNLRTKIFV